MKETHTVTRRKSGEVYSICVVSGQEFVYKLVGTVWVHTTYKLAYFQKSPLWSVEELQ